MGPERNDDGADPLIFEDREWGPAVTVGRTDLGEQQECGGEYSGCVDC